MSAKVTSFAIDAGAFVATTARFGFFLGFWLALIGFSPVNLAVGLPAAATAVWVSLRLSPPSSGRRVRYLAMAGFALRLPWKSLLAGFDVARRALDPRMPLRTGFVAFPARLPPGPERDTFRAVMSLQPGSLPVSAEENGDILFHCLDTSQPISAQLAAEEARFLRLLGRAPGDV